MQLRFQSNYLDWLKPVFLDPFWLKAFGGTITLVNYSIWASKLKIEKFHKDSQQISRKSYILAAPRLRTTALSYQYISIYRNIVWKNISVYKP